MGVDVFTAHHGRAYYIKHHPYFSDHLSEFFSKQGLLAKAMYLLALTITGSFLVMGLYGRLCGTHVNMRWWKYRFPLRLPLC